MGAVHLQKIAIIDDFEESCELMRDVLGTHYDCQYICDVDRAISFLEDYKPDLILLDYKMPVYTGVELCKVIKSNSNIKNIPIIFVSGAVTSDERIETLESGGDDFIAKPFHPKELLLRVQKRIEQKKIDTKKQRPEKIDTQLVIGNLILDRGTRLIYIDDKPITLTPKQFNILEMLIQNKDSAVSREDFMNELWANQIVKLRNVDSQVNYLRNRLEGFCGEIHAITGFGYRIVDHKNGL